MAVSDQDFLQFGAQVETTLSNKGEGRELRLAEYVAKFDEWYEDWRSRASAEGGTTFFSSQVGEEILTQHERILSLAMQFKDEVAASLRDLKRKGKALRTYSDQLPSRISTIFPKRG